MWSSLRLQLMKVSEAMKSVLKVTLSGFPFSYLFFPFGSIFSMTWCTPHSSMASKIVSWTVPFNGSSSSVVRAYVSALVQYNSSRNSLLIFTFLDRPLLLKHWQDWWHRIYYGQQACGKCFWNIHHSVATKILKYLNLETPSKQLLLLLLKVDFFC